MIDIHTHILHGVDDGPNDLIESIKMIEEKISEGVKVIVVAPHYVRTGNYNKTYDEILLKFNELKNEVRNRKLDIEIYLAQEVYRSSYIITLLNEGIISTINNSKYIFIEFPKYRRTDIEQIIYELTVRGYVPIITHPERYRYITKIDEIREYIRLGALMQIHTGSITGVNGFKSKHMAKRMLKANLVHFVASEQHHPNIPKLSLGLSFHKVEKLTSKRNATQLFFENPSKVLLNTNVVEKELVNNK